MIENAPDVDEVMEEFFTFIRQDVLLSTDALGAQADMLSRAARYAGKTGINNKFCDLLDIAADKDEFFDMQNNHRGFLMQHFGIEDHGDALLKAKSNIRLYQRLKEYGND